MCLEGGKMSKYYEIVKKLQEENKGKIVLVRNGIFYCAIGKDAVLLHNILGYIPVCFKEGVCKCGIPTNGIEIAIPRLIRSGYGFIIYDYEKENKTTKEILRIEGRYVDEKENNINCKKCWYNKNKEKKLEEYSKTLSKLIQEREKEDERK